MPLIVVSPLLLTRDRAFTKTGYCGSLAGLFYRGTPHSWLFLMLRLSLAFKEGREWVDISLHRQLPCGYGTIAFRNMKALAIILLSDIQHFSAFWSQMLLFYKIFAPSQPELNVNRKSVLLLYPTVWHWELLKVLQRQIGWGKVAPWAASLQVVFGGTSWEVLVAHSWWWCRGVRCDSREM